MAGRIVVGVFFGAFFGYVGGAIIVGLFLCLARNFPGVPFMEMLTGGGFGLYVGSLLGFLIAIVDRGWRAGLVIGVLPALAVTWLFFRDNSRNDTLRGWLALILLDLICVGVGALVALVSCAIFEKIRSRPGGLVALTMYLVLGFYYLYVGPLLVQGLIGRNGILHGIFN
ncbi:MAG: hypothetical protein ABIP75_01550 [Pyrinomonadaceae bacterium]